VRITLKRAWADGTVAVDMDPLSLLCRLATSVPPPRHHTVKYSGVLAGACRWRSRTAPPPPKPVEQNKPRDERRACVLIRQVRKRVTCVKANRSSGNSTLLDVAIRDVQAAIDDLARRRRQAGSTQPLPRRRSNST